MQQAQKGKASSLLCRELSSDSTLCPVVNGVNDSEPHGEVHQTRSVLSDVQLRAEDVPCTLCTVQGGGRKGR